MDCYRCQGRIKSCKIMKHRTYRETSGYTGLMTTTYYCKHCFNALNLKE